tara:strand:- start:439 stop:723 length:285 start_codon:yes stop_codon:yes gene_type:complete
MLPGISGDKAPKSKLRGNEASRRRDTIVDGKFANDKTPNLKSVAKILQGAMNSSGSLKSMDSGYTSQESISSGGSPLTLPPIAPVVVEDMGSLA